MTIYYKPDTIDDMIQDIFKTPLYNTVFDHLDNKSMIDYVLQYKQNNPSVVVSNDGGYQSQILTGAHLPLNELFKDIDYTCNAYCQRLGMKMPTKIDNLWININPPGSYNIAHRHPLSLISGVFYLSVPKGSGGIVFTNPIDKFDMFFGKNVVDNYTPYNTVDYEYNPIANELILFPSFLTHRVMTNNSDSDRISLAFNCSVIV